MQVLSAINTPEKTFTVHFVASMKSEPMRGVKVLVQDTVGICVLHPSVESAYIPWSSIACLVTEQKPKKRSSRKKKSP